MENELDKKMLRPVTAEEFRKVIELDRKMLHSATVPFKDNINRENFSKVNELDEKMLRPITAEEFRKVIESKDNRNAS